MKINTKNMLQNKFVLYLVFFLSLITVFGYITTNNYQSVLLFLLISLLTSYFSKNMIIILGAAILGTHLVTLINGNSPFLNNYNREGFIEGNTNESNTNESNTNESNNNESNNNESNNETDPADDGKTQQDEAEDYYMDACGTVINKEDFTNFNLSPASIIDNIPNINNFSAKTDKAKALEKSHEMLDQLMSTDGIRNMNTDTKTLLDTQVELMDQIKHMAPLLQKTMGMVNNIDIGKLMDVAKNITSNAAATAS